MTLWACVNCGVVIVQTSRLSISSNETQKGEDESGVEYYIEKGVCPGCGGAGCPVEQVSDGEQNN